MSKSDRKEESKAVHAKCFDEMDKIGRELLSALAEKNDQKAYESQLLQRIQATEAEGSSKLQQAIALKEAALAENRRLHNEIRQLQQQVESVNVSTQDNIPWNDVQPILHKTHGELVSATTRYWNAYRRSPEPQTSILSTRLRGDPRKLDGAVRPARIFGTQFTSRIHRIGQSLFEQSANAWGKQCV
ncbi:hypothetical protein N7451_012279 [Penicillium sp. IBT 35674x]|nr:hypothetical protein N7451_012279 [Penicillium sp. IBT 35674x]